MGKKRLITLDLKDIPAGTNYDLALYDETGNLLISSTRSGNNDKFLAMVVSESGSYRFKVYSVSGFSRAEGYSLQLRVGVAGIPKTKQE